LIKRESLKTTKKRNTHNKPVIQKDGLSLLVVANFCRTQHQATVAYWVIFKQNRRNMVQNNEPC